VPGNEIRVQMSLENVPNFEPVLLGCFDVLIDIALRIDDRRLSFRPNHVRPVRQAPEIELFKVHDGISPNLSS
jgi:hypothetical protein